MELEVSPRHGILTPSSVAVLSGLGGSGGNSSLERLCGSVLVGFFSLTFWLSYLVCSSVVIFVFCFISPRCLLLGDVIPKDPFL